MSRPPPPVSLPISAPVADAMARDPRIRAALARLDAGQRDHVRRAIAAAIEARLKGAT